MAADELKATAHSRNGAHLSGVPVLLYHGIAGTDSHILSTDELRYCITPEQFREHLAMLRDGEFRVITLDNLLAQDVKLSLSSVVFTFDDGLSSDHAHALPMLKQHSATGHFFVNTGAVGRPGRMDWSQIKELDDAGMHIGSHGHDHVDLSREPVQVIERQMRRSREILEDKLQHPVLWFSAPYGLISRRMLTAVQQSGFSGICTSHCWPAECGNFQISRVAIHAHTTREEFSALLMKKPITYVWRELVSAGKYIPRKLLLRLHPGTLGVDVLREQQ